MFATTSLLAAACGSSATSIEADAKTDASVGTDINPSQGPEPAADDAGAGEAAEETAGESAPATNLFPDLDVVNVADASTLNLAVELGGGDRPVLLWFWAPH